VTGEICHIAATSPNGPRHDIKQTAAQRHGYDNLILLCAIHHAVIDDDPEAYTVARLAKMKADHEKTAGTIPDSEAANCAQLLLSVNQSGGIAAHTINAQTINIHAPPSAATPSRNAVPDAAGMMFFRAGAILASAGFPGEQDFVFEGKRAIYLRVFAPGNHSAVGLARLQEIFRGQKPCPMSLTLGGVAARNEHGAIIYDPISASVIGALTQGFETGELWGLNDRLFVVQHRNMFPGQPTGPIYALPMIAVEKIYVRSLTNYVKVADNEMQLPFPYTVELGAFGLKNAYLGVPGGPSNMSQMVGPIMRDAFRRTYTLEDHSDAAIRNLLKTYFDDFYDLAACSRADVLTDQLVAAHDIAPR
jgi:hypothetical protein